jgi:Protein of unknown function (DUF1553)/Protein of unknown function (DUF1549)
MSKRRTIAKSLMMVGVCVFGLSVLGATLRRRPAIEPPRDIESPYVSDGFQATLATVNSKLAKTVADSGLEAAPPADSLSIAKRASLAMLGSGMSYEEIRALQLVPESERVHWWTSRMLSDPRWSDYFAQRLSRAYVGSADGPFLLFRRRKFNAWLAERLADDKTGYNQIVHAMISAEGLWTDTPQVNFVTATMDEANNGRGDPIRLAGRTSRAFLAQRMDCLQCHDDFLDKLNFGSEDNPVPGEQEHFHSLAAFYAGTSAKNPFTGITEDDKPYEFQFLNESEARSVTATVPFLADLLPADGKPRERLANWVTHPENRAFARAAVNRLWALMFSRPLVEPVDDIPIDAQVPAVLDVLADDFVSHGYKLKRLIRLIIESDAFRRESRADFAVTEAHEKCWAVFPISQLRPEQVAGRLFQACSLTALDSTSSVFTQLKVFGDTQEFLQRFGDKGEDDFEANSVTIPQRLIMMNGNLVTERTKSDLIANAATRIADMVRGEADAVEAVFLTVMNRLPSLQESETFAQFLKDKSDNRREAVSDIYWALLNSTEFSWNH